MSAQTANDLKNEYIKRNIQDSTIQIIGKEDPILVNEAIPPEPTIDEKTKKSTPVQKLTDMAGKADNVLLKVSTVWPFTLFVHDIIVDPYKVNVIYREFFYSSRIHSILIKDITDIYIETSLFFATIKIVDLGFVENIVEIPYLKKDDALRVRKIVQGLVIAQKQSIDMANMPATEIRNQTEELGKVKGIDDEPELTPQFA